MSKLKIWLILLVFNALLWGLSLSYGFSQDDFFHLAISRVTSLRDFLNFFNPVAHDWIFFRPLSTQLWYWFFDAVFGFSHAPIFMHLASILLHSTNGYLIYRLLTDKFGTDKPKAIILSLIYLSASLHFLSLYYLGATQQLLMTFFSLMVIYSYLSGHLKNSVIFFVLALLSKELALRLIPIILIMDYYRGANVFSVFNKSKWLIITGIVYLLFRYLAGINSASEYLVSFSPTTTLATVMWYWLMLLGAPEAILRYGLSGGKINWMAYINDFGILGSLNLVLLTITALLLLYNLRRSRWLILAGLWLASLTPVIFLPTHRYAHYLDIALFVILLFLSRLNLKNIQFFAAFFVLTNLSGYYLDYHTHWTTARAVESEIYQQKIIGSGACQQPALYFLGSKKDLQELSYSLMNNHGPQIMCNQPSLEVYYVPDADLATIPPGSPIIKVE